MLTSATRNEPATTAPSYQSVGAQAQNTSPLVRRRLPSPSCEPSVHIQRRPKVLIRTASPSPSDLMILDGEFDNNDDVTALLTGLVKRMPHVS